MIRLALIPFQSQVRTFSPRLTSRLANIIEKESGSIAKKHTDITTQSDLALADLNELRHVEADLELCRQVLSAEREAVKTAISILNGEPTFYCGQHPLVAHAENLITQITTVKMVDSDLSVLELSDEIQFLTELEAELNEASTTANNRVIRAIDETRKARGLALCRVKDPVLALKTLPEVNPLPQTGDWLKVDSLDSKTIVNRCRLAAKADQGTRAEKRAKAVIKVKDQSMTSLLEAQ
jgi:hypothetical protein